MKNILILITLILTSVACSSTKNREQPRTIKVMSYNIHYGLGMDKKYDIERIARAINNQAPDIVGLQEISDSTMAARLGELTGMHYVFGPSKESMKKYGDAILSKHPFKWVGNLSIPSASSSRYQAMVVDVDLSDIYGKGSVVRFINTHFDYLETIGSEESRLAAIEVIEKGFVSTTKLPVILTADLNAKPESPTLKKIEKYGWANENLGKSLNTYIADNPTEQIDYVLFRPKERWIVDTVRVINEPIASDHFPIVMILELKK